MFIMTRWPSATVINQLLVLIGFILILNNSSSSPNITVQGCSSNSQEFERLKSVEGGRDREQAHLASTPPSPHLGAVRGLSKSFSCSSESLLPLCFHSILHFGDRSLHPDRLRYRLFLSWRESLFWWGCRCLNHRALLTLTVLIGPRCLWRRYLKRRIPVSSV